MHTRNEKPSKGQRCLFAVLFAVVPNAIAFPIAFGGQSLVAMAYLVSLSFLFVSLDEQSLAAGITGCLLTLLLDASTAYLVTALKNRWLWVGLLVAYVAISRGIAFYVLVLYVASHT